MLIETLITERLKSSGGLSGILAAYGGSPAVFYQNAPDDKSASWGKKTQYPRLVFDLDRHADTERKSAGTLLVSVLCDSAGTDPEAVEPLVMDCLEGVFLKPDGHFPYCLAWARTDPFEVPSKDEGARRVIGQEIRFDILALPMQEMTDPDPVLALNRFIHEVYPDAVVVGLTHMGDITEATIGSPVYYTRFIRAEQTEVTNTVVWMNGQLSIHIVCRDADARMKLIADLYNQIAAASEIIMADGSPMRPVRLSADNTADYLRTGQVHTTMYFGILRYRRKPHRIMKANMDTNAKEG